MAKIINNQDGTIIVVDENGVETVFNATDQGQTNAQESSNNTNQSTDQTTDNPFSMFDTNSGRYTDNISQETPEETTGSLIQNVEQDTNVIEGAYNQSTPDNTTTDSDIQTSVSSNLGNVPRYRSGIDPSTAGAFISAIVASIAALTFIILILKDNVATPLNAQRKRESMLNANTKEFFEIKNLNNYQTEFLQGSLNSKKQKKIVSDIIFEKETIEFKKLGSNKKRSLVRAFSKGTKSNQYKNVIVEKDNLNALRNVINLQTKIAEKENSNNNLFAKRNQKIINSLTKEQEKEMANVSLGKDGSNVHFAMNVPNLNKSEEFESTNTTPLYTHRSIAVSNNEKTKETEEKLVSVLHSTHKTFPYVDKNIKVCKFKFEIDDEPITLECAFDNDLGYKVLKATMLQKFVDLKAEYPQINSLEIYEQAKKGNKIVEKKEKFNLDFENDVITLSYKVDNANQYLDNVKKMQKITAIKADRSI